MKKNRSRKSRDTVPLRIAMDNGAFTITIISGTVILTLYELNLDFLK